MLKIEPQNPRTGVPITVVSTSNEVIQVFPKDKTAGEPFELKWKDTKSELKQAEFVLMIPGEYLLKSGIESTIFRVDLQRDLSFFIEFGLLGSLVLFFLAGIMIWTIKKKSSI